MSRIALLVLWLAHWLPLPLLALLGRGLGLAGYLLAAPRRRVCLTNLRLCFPELTERQRRRLARAHFQWFGRFVLDHGIQWHAPLEHIRQLVQFEDEHHLRAVQASGRNYFFLAPHFLGLDMGGVRLMMETECSGMYTRQKDARLDAAVLSGRMRFATGRSRMFSRQDGFRAVVRAVRSGVAFFYMPDMDLGARDSIFVPFFGVPTATITGPSRLAQVADAVMIPVVTRILPGGGGYRVRFYPPWTDFPSGDVEADTRRVNAFIEERARELPEQYYWLHKRFKTRPPGEPRLY
jgi:KDO2-lipid IV(A) lauroyltransferase